MHAHAHTHTHTHTHTDRLMSAAGHRWNNGFFTLDSLSMSSTKANGLTFILVGSNE